MNKKQEKINTKKAKKKPKNRTKNKQKNKKKIKIGFKYFWYGFNPEDNLFINLLKKQYDVILSDNPDYLFYSVYPESGKIEDPSKIGIFLRKISPDIYLFLKKVYSRFKDPNKNKRPVPKGDFVRIFYTSENRKPNMQECDWAFSFYYDEEFKHSRHMRLPNYKFEELEGSLVKKQSEISKIDIKKRKFCNFIYAQENKTRRLFFRKLSKYKRIDSPGRVLNNMPPIGKFKDSYSSRFSKNWMNDKIPFLENYKFTIAFENASVPGYTTEKITHPMLANSIPIYFGNPLVGRDFNTKSFINCHDFKNFDEVVKRVIEIDKDDELYEKILREPWFYNNKPSKYMSDEMIMKRLKEIFG